MGVRLRLPKVEDAKSALEAHREFLDCPYIDFLIDYRDKEAFADWVTRMNEISLGIYLPEGWVRGEFLFVEADGHLVGRVSIRYELNEYLREFEGHVGYAVLPQYRRRGYASCALRESLERLYVEGVESVLITCDDDNEASIRVIEREGGTYERMAKTSTVRKRRYWL